MNASVIYLSPGLFDKGGISRYCRYQTRALREILGPKAVAAYSLLSPDGRGFEDPIDVQFSSLGPTAAGKALFSIATILGALRDRPTYIWSAHIHFAALALALSRATGAKMIQNVYGLEVWTDLAKPNEFAVRRADAVISDCHATLEFMGSHDLLPPAITTVHWDCVDLSRFHPAERDDVLARYGVPKDPGAITLLTLGRLDRADSHKGFARLIQTMDRIADDTRLRLVIAGDGAARGTLAKMAAQTRARERIHFTGSIHEDDLPAVYRACDVFALVSDRGHGRGEGIPLTPLEAAACGRPIIVGNQDGSREAAVHGVSGFVLDPFDIDGLADLLTRLSGDEELRERIGRAAHDRIVREHSYKRFVERTREVLRAVDVAER